MDLICYLKRLNSRCKISGHYLRAIFSSEVPLSDNNAPIYTKDVDNTPSVLLKWLKKAG
jgi:hypothetical protein